MYSFIVKPIIDSLKSSYSLLKDFILDTFFDDGVMSSIAMKIMSNPSDKIKYMDAVDRLNNGSDRETITLETVGEITITNSVGLSKSEIRDKKIDKLLNGKADN